jgi:2-oxoacid:acceptor oxidoreductase delta subunit (pyruvate/2-ketoisovalerate family)
MIMKIKSCDSNIIDRRPEKSLSVKERLKGDFLVKKGYDETTALAEAKRCLANITCQSCELCRLLCPELCITKNEKTNGMEIDYDFCKNCGICVMVCPKGAISMEG